MTDLKELKEKILADIELIYLSKILDYDELVEIINKHFEEAQKND
jgi:hypothetical protein